MRLVKLRVFGIALLPCSCVALPVTDLDASTSDASDIVSVTSTGGATSSTVLSGTGGSVTAGTSSLVSTSGICTSSFTACGGDPTGIWDIVGVCVQGDIAAAANAEYASSASQCSDICTGAKPAAQGSVTFSAGNYQPNAVVSLTETLVVSDSCYAALWGQSWTAASCTTLAQDLSQQAGTTATCTPTSTSCDCVYETVLAAQSDTYTVSGSLLVASDGTTTEFCVQGSTMTQRDWFGNSAYAVTIYGKR